jgi:hypothetical protein
MVDTKCFVIVYEKLLFIRNYLWFMQETNANNYHNYQVNLLHP